MKTITYLSVLLLGITLFTFSCKKNKDEVNDFSLKEESFDITIKGSNPNGSIDSKIAFCIYGFKFKH